jgi:hypothetical protein
MRAHLNRKRRNVSLSSSRSEIADFFVYEMQIGLLNQVYNLYFLRLSALTPVGNGRMFLAK